MSYATEKEKIEAKIKIWKRVLLGIVVFVLLFLCAFSAFVPPSTWKYRVSLPRIAKRANGEMRIHFLDVGQGDATLIELPDGKCMLIDGGNGTEKTAIRLLRYLNALKIKKVDYLLSTHADSDHCGGLDKVVEQKKIGLAYLPKVSKTANDEYADFYAALLERECEMVYSSRSVSIDSKNSDYPFTLSFLYPYTHDVESVEEWREDANAYSAVVWLDYQGVSALFTGDAPTSTEDILMRDDEMGLFKNRGVELTSTEILKVAHHGSADSTSLGFLQYIHAETAVISCGVNNLYGHPSKEVCQRLGEAGVTTYRTDQDDNVMITVSKSGEYTVKKISF